MNLFAITALASLIVNIMVAAFIVWMNPRRRVNRFFAIASCMLSLWLLTLLCGVQATTDAAVIFWVRQAGVAAALLPVAFDLLRHAITTERSTAKHMFAELRIWLFFVLPIAVVCQLPGFVVKVDVGPDGFPVPTYGPLQIVYWVGWILELATLIRRFKKSFRSAAGDQRFELEFTVLGFVVACLTGLAFGQLLPTFFGHEYISQFTPLSVIIFEGVVAYGVATRRIMNVGDVLRRATAYALLGTYLTAVYVATIMLLGAALEAWTPYAISIAHFSGAMIVAMSLTPARGAMQRVANRLFINLQGMDVRGTIRRGTDVLMAIGNMDELLARFATVVEEATGTDRVIIMLNDESVARQVYPQAVNGSALSLEADDLLLAFMNQDAGVLDAVGLRRGRHTQASERLAKRMQNLNAALLIPIRRKGEVCGLLLVGARLSGRAYSAAEQEALLLLSDQLGVAVDNAQLYTEVQNSSIYNDILVDSLTSGMVAANTNGLITVCNQEALRICGLEESSVVVGQATLVLPEALQDAIRETLSSGKPVRDLETVISANPDEPAGCHVRLSSSVFYAHTGELLGVLVVFTDTTMLKRLEEQVRRTDRLASLGTLSAGMAHEIKNPLVSLRTFTELLPTKYGDPEFRETFAHLLGDEVKRIDNIVDRLLKFSRPAPASLVPLSLHEEVSSCLKLMSQEIRRHDVELQMSLQAEDDVINGDANLLRQALVNFVLNALEAMDTRGTLTVETQNVGAEWYGNSGGHTSEQPRGRYIRLSVRDTGSGIKDESVAQIFDPFFSTKSNGTGLGLSVSHGIIQEHGATIEVDSAPHRGTIFHIVFPAIEPTPQLTGVPE